MFGGINRQLCKRKLQQYEHRNKLEMFGIFNKKNKKGHFKAYRLESVEQSSIDDVNPGEYINNVDDYPRIDRLKLAQNWDSLEAKSSENTIGKALEDAWVSDLLQTLESTYAAFESDHFIHVTSQNEKHTSLFLKAIENIRLRIINALGDILENSYKEKFIIILFDQVEDYYQYISYYYPKEGQFAHSSGCFLNDAIPHFTLPMTDMSSVESVVAHELTHAMVSHLPIPLWLNEGLAVNMEVAITGYNPHRLNTHRHNKHLSFWGEMEIQEFWSGGSFSRADDGNELSYQLAQLIVRSLAENTEEFYAFVKDANHSDGGEAAFHKAYGYSLSEIIENLLGEGDWTPNPIAWER
jgi:hypothetical protein